MEEKSKNKILKSLWWPVYIAVAILVAVVVQSKVGIGLLESPMNRVEPAIEKVANPSDPHEPVHIRLGVIVEIGVDYIVVETKKIVGQGNERITALLVGDTSVIEIQIPSFMNAKLRQELKESGDVIPRVEKSKNDLYVSQTVEVVSVSDMYGYKEVVATRVEYKVIINTEEEV